jgi:hypothetical protein
MTDIPDTQLVAFGLSIFSVWFMGFYFGKLAGRQQAEERHRTQMKALRAAKRRENSRH